MRFLDGPVNASGATPGSACRVWAPHGATEQKPKGEKSWRSKTKNKKKIKNTKLQQRSRWNRIIFRSLYLASLGILRSSIYRCIGIVLGKFCHVHWLRNWHIPAGDVIQYLETSEPLAEQDYRKFEWVTDPQTWLFIRTNRRNYCKIQSLRKLVSSQSSNCIRARFHLFVSSSRYLSNRNSTHPAPLISSDWQPFSYACHVSLFILPLCVNTVCLR